MKFSPAPWLQEFLIDHQSITQINTCFHHYLLNWHCVYFVARCQNTYLPSVLADSFDVTFSNSASCFPFIHFKFIRFDHDISVQRIIFFQQGQFYQIFTSSHNECPGKILSWLCYKFSDDLITIVMSFGILENSLHIPKLSCVKLTICPLDPKVQFLI